MRVPTPGRDEVDATMTGEARPDVTATALGGASAGDCAVDPGHDSRETFPQSVASGGPTPAGVILWTRLAPDAVEAGEPLAVEVADDDGFEESVVRGVVSPERIGPAYDHTVRVDLDGALSPDRSYAYRFVYDGTASPVGRCRTLPAPDATPESVRLAVVACQDYENGYYGAFDHVARADVDFLVHLGDLVYESADRLYTGLGSRHYADRGVTLPSGEDRASSLADFRHLHRLYRDDRFFQRALERHTLVAGWDDHGVANNRYWDYDADAPATPGHPRGDDPAFMRDLTRAGIRAWYEYLPARIRYDPDAERIHDSFRLYRSLRFGTLVDLALTDQRLFRSEPGGRYVAGVNLGLRRDTDPSRTMLGDDQLAWFEAEIAASETTWFAWANAVLSLPIRVGAGPLSIYPKQDSWDGYAAERAEIFETLAAREAGVVTLTGDMHSTVAGYQQTAYPGLGDRGEPTRVGVEFMTPAVTSVNVAEAVGVNGRTLGRVSRPLLSRGVRAMNPHMRAFDSHHWGYSVVEFTPEACTFTTYAVDKTVDTPGEKQVLFQARVPSDRYEIEPV
ncbi:alkaline phosphatase D family protein [Salinigranum salinum]|uniref:alkaline phosphatase D family protein n=1 Tax=Salinigranum salinum TaxID=1364937 RepID=UPI0012611124|nr:alkaline phosphatase D family protein [Salinigranum salinum]